MRIKKRFNVVKIKRINGIDVINKYSVMIILTALFISGVIIGAFIVKNGSAVVMAKLSQIFTGYKISKSSQSMLAAFSNSMLINMLFLAASFVFGMCCVGVPVICALPLIRGFGMGVIGAYLYNTFALSGVGYFALTILPGAAVSITLMLISCNESYKTSLDLLHMLTGAGQVKSGLIKRYLSVYMFIVALSSLGSLTDMFMTKFFSSLFSI